MSWASDVVVSWAERDMLARCVPAQEEAEDEFMEQLRRLERRHEEEPEEKKTAPGRPSAMGSRSKDEAGLLERVEYLA